MRKLMVLATAMFLAGTAQAGHRHFYGGVGVYVGPWWAPPTFVYEGPPNRGMVDCDVEPEDARVFVDGKEVGEADDFDGYPRYLALRPGHHRVEFRHKGYETLAVDVDMKAGWLFQVEDDMDKGDPAKKVVRKSGPPPGATRYDDDEDDRGRRDDRYQRDRRDRDGSDQDKDDSDQYQDDDRQDRGDHSQQQYEELPGTGDSDDYEGYDESDMRGSSS
ncbi:MAG: hypothetical protein U0166_26045 [Acidobacteriota bacterium]